MCGIAGIFNFDGRPVQQAELNRMTDAIAHRGPDGEGFYVDGSLGLGHRRLAILDLSATGKQPMEYANGRYWITLNGEIYNFLEIADEVKGKGYVFRSSSDTEVVLAAYDCWGPECLFKFNGMWAFAIWDRKERELFIARDRFGVKPLFYITAPGRFTFASEIKSILKTLPGRPDPNPVVLCDVLSGRTPDLHDETIYKGIFRIPAGSWMKVNARGEIKKRDWWKTLDHLPEIPEKETEQVERYKELLTDAVRIRLRSDVPVGSLLSGGLDSSAIVCTIAKHGNDPVWHGTGQRLATDWQRTFTAQYPGLSADESDYAQAVLDATGIQGTWIRPIPEHIGDFIKHMVAQQDAPVDQSLYAVHSVYKAVGASGTKVTLDGQGADEALCGYSAIPAARHYLKAFNFFETWSALKCQSALLGGQRSVVQLGLELAKQEIAENFHPKRLLRRLLHRLPPQPRPSPSGAPSFTLLEHLPPDKNSLPPLGLDYLNRSLYDQICHTPLPTILRRFDHAAMAYSVESRMPFMDYRLIAYTLALPASQKVSSGNTKVVLRQAMKGTVPEVVLRRKAKLGFPIPYEWLDSPEAREWCGDVIANKSFKECPYWDARRFEQWYEDKNKSNGWSGADLNHIINVFSTSVWLAG